MASVVNPPRGMRDFLPVEKARRERVLAVIRGAYRDHGFDEIETPVVEDSARLHAGLGGDNEKLAFAVMKRGLTTEALQAASEPLDLADLGLRFDLTVPLARFYASHRPELPTVFRAIQIAPVWRAERPQKGRFRQFVQCDIDIIGDASPLAELELITATADALGRLGLSGCVIRINDRRILADLVAHWGVAPEQLEQALVSFDKLDKIGIDGVTAELTEKGLGDAARIRETLTAIEALPEGGWTLLDDPPVWLRPEVGAELAAIRDAVGALAGGVGIAFSPNLVRGMGYYTGTVFEIAHPDLPYSLGGGGRYDGMIGRFLGTDVPAAGFSLGFERLVDLVESAEQAGERSVVLVHDADVPGALLVTLKAGLVASGCRVRLAQRPKKLAGLLDALAAEGFGEWASVRADTAGVEALELKPLG